MGWDYWAYMSQPDWFIQAILMRYKSETQAEKYLNRKYGTK